MKTYEELMAQLLAQPRRAPMHPLTGVLQPQEPAQEPTQVQPKGTVTDAPKGKTQGCGGCGEAARLRRAEQRAKRGIS